MTSSEKTFHEVIALMKAKADPSRLEGMARYGISVKNCLGIKAPELREIAKVYKKNPELAAILWDSEIHEARILSALVDDPKKITPEEMERRVKDFDSWDICDASCMMLFDRTPYAFDKAMKWARRDEEYVRRAGFALMASLALKRHKLPDETYFPFFEEIYIAATDNRNFVKKAVNWALRSIGKRNETLRLKALESCGRLYTLNNKTASWIAKDAEKELVVRY
ncbi:MAG: DNA alkylation repair protein [Ignavibacteriales bacterium]|nr:MAG: DNA alkylation repair protein [Ignavibacteriales bacterium]